MNTKSKIYKAIRLAIKIYKAIRRKWGLVIPSNLF